MYPDPVTPKSDPALLQDPAYDPFGLMPRALPDHPRVTLSAAQLARARRMVRAGGWPAAGLARLLAAARRDEELPARLPAAPEPAVNRAVLALAERNALAHLLTGEAEFRERGLRAFRLLAESCAQWPRRGDARAGGGGLAESRFNWRSASAYDLLAAGGLAPADDALFRAMLEAARPVIDACQHLACGNHNSWAHAARVAVGAALGDRALIHDALYGCDRGGGWRYGVIHQLRHDILSDGMHWEGTLGYHFYTMMAFTQIAAILGNIDVDLWHAELPPLRQDEGKDLHRAYGPDHGRKGLKAMFDAPFYQAFADGNVSMLHDSGLRHLRGAWTWGIVYNLAWEAYRDPAYAWLLTRMEEDYPREARPWPDLPMPLNTDTGEIDFARLARAQWPAGRFSRRGARRLSLSGAHRGGCSLFPVHGSAVLRSDPDDPRGVGAFLYWGPHCAGHMGPAALHLDLEARGRPVTDAPSSGGGYGAASHLTWNRTTLAHNTVTVDEFSMFPYDFDSESLWEADRWRDRTSDGRLLLFQPAAAFKAVRAVNDVVYPGTRLDRTVVIAGDMVLDVYRALSEAEHQYDWAAHLAGEVSRPAGAAPAALGTRRGYRHLADAVRCAPEGEGTEAGWSLRTGAAAVRLLAPPRSALILARDLVPEKAEAYGALEPPGPHSCVLVRVPARRALFLSLWTFDGAPGELALEAGEADSDLVLATRVNGRALRWSLPFAERPVRVSAL